MKTQIRIAIKMFVLFTLLLGLAYPLLITGIAQIAFPKKANGSLIIQGNKVIGSELIGQKFDSIIYFSSRPSAPDYGALPSGGSNLGPTSQKLKQLVDERAAQFAEFNQLHASETIPSEMVFASASGLDPHISPRAAMVQVERISKFRNLNEIQKVQLTELVNTMSESPQFGLFGKERVNVLLLNLKLDRIY
ncbi:MAG: potassium-transporting ATPase subunit KdpC [Prolixibacteraceae bacterium]|nr:potassium-transporting ATPase subunit KdpC [Prolixibacteraceae bacterium]